MPIAVVTGASGHIGRATALAFAKAKYDVVVHAHSQTALLAKTQRLIADAGQTSWAIVADLSNEDGQNLFCEQVLSQVRVIDALVHNAGIFEEMGFAQVTRGDYQKVMTLNLEAPFFLTQNLLKLLKKSSSPCVINVIDTMYSDPWPGHSHYVLSKAGLAALTRSLAIELAPLVRVNGVAPGAITLPEHYDLKKRARIVGKIPLKKMGTSRDVAEAIVYLAAQATYVTGQILSVDGGRNVTS
jgi:pteridine reductase